MREIVSGAVAQCRFQIVLIMAFAELALVLAIVGILRSRELLGLAADSRSA